MVGRRGGGLQAMLGHDLGVGHVVEVEEHHGSQVPVQGLLDLHRQQVHSFAYIETYIRRHGWRGGV
jgi:hypothetical protein